MVSPELNNQIESGYIICFYDKYNNKPNDSTGYNTIAVALDNKEILFNRNNKLIISPVVFLNVRKVTIIIPKEIDGIRIAKYFQFNKHNYRLFNLGLRAIISNKKAIIDTIEIMPNFNAGHPGSIKCFEWNKFIKLLKDGELLVTFDTNSFISKFISKLDNGSWSHCGIYTGNGNIIEAIASGVQARNINVYNKPNIHIGAYRAFDMNAESVKQMIKWTSGHIGCGYNYVGAIKLGIKMILGIKSKIPTPNGLIYSGSFYLVAYT